MARDGSVGRETYAQVNAIVEADKVTRSEAFKRVAEKRKQQAGTVAANYYRIARAEGAVIPRKRRAKATRTAPAPRRQSTRRSASRTSSDIDRLTADLVRSVQALADSVKQQEAEVIQLRERLAGVAKAIS